MSRLLAYFLFSLAVLLFAAFFLWPIAQILKGGFIVDDQFTLVYLLEVFRNPLYLEGLLNAFGIGLFSTLFAALIAIPLAYAADRYEFPAKRLLGGLVLLPILLPPFVGAIGIQQILGQYGVFNVFLSKLGWMDMSQPVDWLAHGRFWGIVLLTALSLYPILYLNVLASLANIDPAMEEAAENMGCRGWKRFFRITLPLMRPGLFAGCTLVFIWSFTELGVPLIFDYNRVTAVQIFNGLKEIENSPFPYALVTVMLVLSVLFYAIGKGLFGRNTFAMLAKAGHATSARRPGMIGQTVCLLLFGGIIFLSLLPHLAVILISFSSDWYGTLLPTGWTLDNYEIALGNGLTVPSIKNSLFYASAAMVVNALFGIGIAFIVVRSTLRGRQLLDAMAMMPLAVPGLVLAFGYFIMSQEGRFFDFLNPIENPTMLLIIAYAVRKLPFMVRAAVAGLQQTSVAYEEAAQNLGCPPWKSALRITTPLIAANLLAGAILVFSQSMLEVSDSLILAVKKQFFPITKAIYELMMLLGDGPFLACALGVWAMAFLGISIVAANHLLGKKLGAIFRF